jgi:sugar phosphate permease
VPIKFAGSFFGGVLALAGLLGTLLGGLAASAWQKRNSAGYASVLTLSVITAAPLAIVAFWAGDKSLSMACLAAAMFFIFLGTGPVNTLILETVPINLRATAMAVSIFMIHLLGDMWSSQIVGHLSDRWASLQRAVMILPAALAVAARVWGALAWRMRPRRGLGAASPSTPSPSSA